MPNFYVSKGAGKEIKVVHRLNNDTNINVLGSNGKHRIHLFGEVAECQIGGNGMDGYLILQPANAINPAPASEARIHLSAINATARVGGNGRDGNIFVCNHANKNVIYIDGKGGDLTVGGDGENGSIFVRNQVNKTVVNIDGKSGDILLENADCAEEFDVEGTAIEPGSASVLHSYCENFIKE